MLIQFSDANGNRYVLDISHSELFFGSNLVGNDAALQTLTLKNAGWADISLREIALSGNTFSIEGENPGVLRPGQKVEFEIGFSPTTGGPSTGSVYIDAGVAGTAYVRLYGAGFSTVDGDVDITGMRIIELASNLETEELLNFENGTKVWVYNDPDLGLNGFYTKNGALGVGSFDGPFDAYAESMGNARIDIDMIEDVATGAANLNGTGLVSDRLGGSHKTIAKLESEFQAKIDAQTLEEETASDSAAVAIAARNAAEAWAEGPGEPGGAGTKSAKGWAQAAQDALSAILIPKKNLFDKATMVRSGKRYSPATDQVITDGNGKCTTFIPVVPGQQIAISGGETGFTGGWFATESDTGVSTDLGFAVATTLVTTVPAGRYFLVVNLTTTNSSAAIDTLQIEVGAGPTAYEPYTLVIDAAKVEGADKFPVMIEEIGTNRIDLTKVNFVKRYSVGSKTFQNDELGIGASDWIPVEEGETYTLSGAGAYSITGTPQGGYFTAYGALTAPSNINWFATPDGNGRSFTVPTGQGITHVVVSLRKLNDLVASTTLHGPVQLQQGELATAWEAFEIRDVVSVDNLPKSVTGGIAGGSTSAFDEDAWLKYVGGEPQPAYLDKWPVFRKKWHEKRADLTVLCCGTSLTARTTEHHSAHPNATTRPPLMHSLNVASYIWDKLAWDGQFYARYDAASSGSEPSGTWATASNLTEWDDAAYREGLTRYCADAGCSFIRNVPAGAWAWRLIHRTDSVAPTVVTVAISGGNNQMQVYDEGTSAWVEANGYTFSQREAAATTRSVSIPNPDTDAFASSTIATKGNTTYQKRLKFRCKWTGVDTRATAKTVTFTNTSGGRLNYWGHEWSKREVMVTFINAARGSHNTQATSSLGLPRFADNEVHSFKPDLIYTELPIHNDGASNAAAYATWDRWGRLTNNYIFRSDYELSLKTRATTYGYTPEIGMWTPSISYGFGGIDEDGQLIVGDQSDGVPMTALDKFDQAAAWVAENKPDAVFVNAVHRWVEAGFAIYGDLKTATATTGKTGPGMTNDNGHDNDIGAKINSKVITAPFAWAN